MRPKHITQILTSAVLAGVLAITAPAHADDVTKKCDNFIKHKLRNGAAGKTQVIVTLDGSYTSAKRGTLKQLGIEPGQELPLVRSVVLRVPNGTIQKLASLPWVLNVSEDVTMNKCDEFM